MTVTNDQRRLRDADEPVRLAGANLRERRHVCALFHNSEEEYRVLLPFILEGLERGERAFHIVDSELREAHRG